jgi:hypothetical protein
MRRGDTRQSLAFREPISTGFQKKDTKATMTQSQSWQDGWNRTTTLNWRQHAQACIQALAVAVAASYEPQSWHLMSIFHHKLVGEPIREWRNPSKKSWRACNGTRWKQYQSMLSWWHRLVIGDGAQELWMSEYCLSNEFCHREPE